MEITTENKTKNLLKEQQSASQAFNLGSSIAISKVVEELDLQASKRIKDGFNEVTFTIGVLNCFVILFIFDNFPQHFWILFIVEGIVLFPTKFFHMIRAVPNEALYFLDFCWIMNFCGTALLLIMMFGRNLLSEQFRKVIFLAAFGISCGPLLGANIALPFVALIFHDVDSMAGLFIHIYPPLLLYVMRWKADKVMDAWPNTFELNYDVNFFPDAEESFVQSIFGASTILYFIWLIPYTIWQLSVGLGLPKNGGKFDTVFHSNMRNGLCTQMGNRLWNRSLDLSTNQMETNNFEMRDFIVYSIFHAIGFFTSLLILAYSCSLSQYIHGVLLAICLILCIWRGARRYTYYSTKMYSNLIRKQFAAELSQDESQCV